MKKLLIAGAISALGCTQFYGQVEINDISQKTMNTERSASEIKIFPNDTLSIGRDKNTPKDTAGRGLLISILTNGHKSPNYIPSASHRAQHIGGTEPENSMEAIKDLVSPSYVTDIVELDIKKSSDGQVYVMHDNYLQRTTNFLDIYEGIGQGSDYYGHYNNYTWEKVRHLTLRKSDFTHTDRRVPLFRDVLKYVKDNTSLLINLDIGDPAVFAATWEVVKEENAFDVCIFKSAQYTMEQYKTTFYDQLTEAQKNKVMFFPMIVMSNPGSLDPMQAYNVWENSGLAKGYELGYRGDPAQNALLDVVDAVRTKNRVRVHVFNTYPDTYEGRYRGNVNIGQCCNDAYDARADWNYLLDPRGTGSYDRGVNGYIITDDPETLDTYLQAIGKKNPR